MLGFSAFAVAPFADPGTAQASIVFPIGVEAALNIGNITPIASANIYPTSLFAVGQLGTITVYPIVNVFSIGLQTQALLNSVATNAGANSTVTGVGATINVGSVKL